MELTALIETGGSNPVLLFVFALSLGALHGLEPGHSKTMMAAYIIAVQGTAKQAALLGLSAAFSHSLTVWVLALLALIWGDAMIGEAMEPWFMMVSGALVLAIAAWMLRQGLRGRGQDRPHHPHAHDHNHEHDHSHDHSHAAPHAPHDHADAHARAHAAQIRARLAAGRTGSWQTVLFGLSGGLIPCPAAITVFLLCLHLGKLALGITLVGAFSLGLAATLVAVGVTAALGLRAVSARSTRLDGLLAAAPWLSAALIALVGLLILWSGYGQLAQPH